MTCRKSGKNTQENPNPEEAFYIPDPNHLKLLMSAFTEEQAVQTALKDNFPIQTLEILAYGRSPMVRSAEKNFQASLELYSQVSNLEDVLRQYSAFNAAVMPSVGNMENTDSIDRKYPFPGIFALKGKIVGLDIQLSKEDIEIARRTAITEIRKLYWELLYNRKAQNIADDSFDFLKNMEASVTRRYETGKAPIQELTKVRIRKERMKEELITIREERKIIERKIKSLLDLSDAVKIGNPTDIEPVNTIPSPEKLTSAAISKRQELKRCDP
ncbi:MAG: TolC family protein [Desulfobacteraceae bacterium]|nr:TolC family protein [Desulfobacteraceae bacterium]